MTIEEPHKDRQNVAYDKALIKEPSTKSNSKSGTPEEKKLMKLMNTPEITNPALWL